MNVKDFILDKFDLLTSEQKKLWSEIDELQDTIGLDVEEYERLVSMQNLYVKLDYQIEILNEIVNVIYNVGEK